jgi:hypothetical protein
MEHQPHHGVHSNLCGRDQVGRAQIIYHPNGKLNILLNTYQKETLFMGPLVPHGFHSQVFTWTDEETLKIDSKLMERRMAEFVHAFIETLQAGRSLWSA